MPDGEVREAYQIDLGTADDFEQILVILFEMHKEVGIFTMSPQKVAAMIGAVIQQGYPIVARTHGGVIAGTVGLIEGCPWYSEDTFLSDRWFFVRKAHRHSRLAENLVEHAKKVANVAGLPLGMGVQDKKDSFRKNALLSRHLTPIGELFMYFPT